MNNYRKYPLNEDAFKTIDADSAYWIGYLYGDGNCTRANAVRLSCAWNDRELIYQFRDFIRSPSKPVKELHNQYCHNATFDIHSWKIMRRLRDYELNLRKEDRSGLLSIDVLQDDVVSHFIRGLFDADGSFFYDGVHKNDLRSEITGYKPILHVVRDVLSYFDVIKPAKKIVKNNTVWRIRMCKRDTIALINFLYAGNPKYYLRRKWGLAKSYLQRLNERTPFDGDATVCYDNNVS